MGENAAEGAGYDVEEGLYGSPGVYMGVSGIESVPIEVLVSVPAKICSPSCQCTQLRHLWWDFARAVE